jgi:hypothetical protein
MKSIVSMTAMGLAIGWSSFVFGESEKDNLLAEMQKCAVCKHLADNPELMKNMVWETHKIDNGMLCLTTVPKEMKKDFDAVSEKMHQAIEQAQADAKEGKEVELCSFCMSMGELMKLPAKQQHIETKTGAIHMVTSDDPEVVKKIHEIADKAIAVQKKMQDERQRTASLR